MNDIPFQYEIMVKAVPKGMGLVAHRPSGQREWQKPKDVSDELRQALKLTRRLPYRIWPAGIKCAEDLYEHPAVIDRRTEDNATVLTVDLG